MAKNKQRRKKTEAALPPVSRFAWGRRPKQILMLLAGCVAAAGIVAWHYHSSHATAPSAAPPPAPLNVNNPTYAQDVAPVMLRHCAVCHHEGGPAPFALTSYAEVSKRAEQIAKVTQSRFMPPWLPAHGLAEYEGERHLSDDEILMLENWSAHKPAGDLARVPPVPRFSSDWQLGTPDLVVQMPRAYTLPAEGRDVYRNFVVPVPIGEDQYIKGIEFRAGSTRIHHAFIFVDSTPASRRREAREREHDSEPGWPGMNALPSSAEPPSAQFTSWQPGRIARIHEDTAWKLAKGTDLVLQLHMQPGGKPEPIQPSIAFYFADRPGSIHPAMRLLRSVTMDIPAGEKDYTVRSAWTTPIDVDVLGVLPHVHYLGKDLKGFATLPDGSRKWLFWIKDWNFNWQSDFTFAQPVVIPKGSQVEMVYTFDNSAGNPFNPNQPPKRVRFGSQSSDEMAELWLQLLPHDERDAPALQQDVYRSGQEDMLTLNTARLREDPTDGHAHLQLGKALLTQGKIAEAEASLRNAVKYDEGNTEAHYFLGYALHDRINDPRYLNECLHEYGRALQLDHENYEALNGLGLTLYQIGRFQEAEAYFVEGLRLQPGDEVIQGNLALVRKALGK